MPEYQTTLKVNYYATDEDQASATADDLASNVLVDGDVISVQGGIPIFVKEDDNA
jgi:hypothetical protein